MRDKMGILHAKRRLTMSWRPQRAAMCKGLSSMDCSVTAATLAPSSTSRQIASTFVGPCAVPVLSIIHPAKYKKHPTSTVPSATTLSSTRHDTADSYGAWLSSELLMQKAGRNLSDTCLKIAPSTSGSKDVSDGSRAQLLCSDPAPTEGEQASCTHGFFVAPYL